MKIRDVLQAILDGNEDDIEVVVRCKDCKYWNRANGRKYGFCEKTKCFDRLWGENDWCSYGENNGRATQPENYGDWICTTDYRLYPFKCPNCGEHQTKASKFCPECGKKMR